MIALDASLFPRRRKPTFFCAPLPNAPQGGSPKLVMGKNQLEGEEVTLKKPRAVMELVKSEAGDSEYKLVGVIRKKIVFKNRPVPISRPELAPDAVTAPDTVMLSTKRQRPAVDFEPNESAAEPMAE